jgi:tRNA(fMet)-specific endonuclease VapC
MRYLLDTNTCVVYLRWPNSPVARKLATLSPESVALCAIVKAELHFGVEQSARPADNRVALAAFFAGFASLPFDDRAAEVYGRLRAQLAKRGTPIGPNDLMIAAIALTNGATLVTHNVGEFSRVPDLQIEDWEATA